MSEYEIADPTDECICHHMIKSHKSSNRWSNKRNEMDCRIKCRYCNCNILLEKWEDKND